MKDDSDECSNRLNYKIWCEQLIKKNDKLKVELADVKRLAIEYYNSTVKLNIIRKQLQDENKKLKKEVKDWQETYADEYGYGLGDN